MQTYTAAIVSSRRNAFESGGLVGDYLVVVDQRVGIFFETLLALGFLLLVVKESFPCRTSGS